MSKEIPIIPIELDKPRKLKLDGNAFIGIEEQTGKNTFNGEIWQSMTTADIITIVWQGLLWEDANVTRDQVAGWYHAGVMAGWMQAIQAAWVDAIDIDEVEGAKDPLAEKALRKAQKK